MSSDPRDALRRELHKIPENWSWRWQDEVFDFQGGAQPPASTFVDGPRAGYVRLIQIRDYYSDGHITYVPDSSKLRKCDADDVMIARYGSSATGVVDNSLGRICRGLSGAYNVALARAIPNEGVTKDFLYYLLNSDYFQRPLLAQGARSVQAGFNRNGLRVIPFPIPPLPEQRAIAHILGTLDDKIALNRRMSATLEELARALFKAWFVDFEPVRANMAGRPSASAPGALGDLFPARLVPSELGEIPEGWGASTIGDEFDLTMGQSPPGSTYNEDGDGTPFYQGKTDFGFRYPSRRVYCTAPTRAAREGDTLVSVRAPVGSINMAAEDCAVGRGVAAIRHKGGSRSYTYYSLQALQPAFGVYESAGTVFGSIGKKDFEALSCIAPSAGIVELFERLCFPIDLQIECSQRENDSLSSLRDMLLPRLVSGELRVGDFEELAER
mgnify:CR=1 FL=1